MMRLAPPQRHTASHNHLEIGTIIATTGTSHVRSDVKLVFWENYEAHHQELKLERQHLGTDDDFSSILQKSGKWWGRTFNRDTLASPYLGRSRIRHDFQ